ncbi:MAG: CBS domain-containing protein [Chloroflexi bacterium]|nr:CBS domain-containing protein [Chloroflexota bacterium]
MSIPTVEQVMSRNPATVSSNDSIRVALDRMRERSCRRLPVVDSGALVGIVSDRDLRRATNSPYVMRERWYDDFMLDHIPVRACMTPNPITISPRTSIAEAARLMLDRKIGGLPVLDEEHLVGIVTETDLLNYLIRTLESQS